MFARAILKIKQMCSHKTNSKNNDNSDDTMYKGNQESSIPSMEKTFEDINNSGILNPSSNQALEEAMKKAKENYATVSAIKQNIIPG